MSKISVPALYQTETFSSGFGQSRPRRETVRLAEPSQRDQTPQAAPGLAPCRLVPFIVQLMATGDPEFRKVIGRTEVAQARERAYGFAAAHRGGKSEPRAELEAILA
jgi:hypothetical protein